MKTAEYAPSMKRLIDELKRLPGIGPKSAERIAFYFLRSPQGTAHAMADAIIRAKKSIRFCPVCYNLTDTEVCEICTSPARDKSLICVVEQPKDIIAIEKSGAFSGTYHVLLGAIAPLDGISPDDLKITELLRRVSHPPKGQEVKEVIIATGFDTEGETTALYLMKALKPFKSRVSRISHGIPFGGKIEYADQATVLRSIELRNAI